MTTFTAKLDAQLANMPRAHAAAVRDFETYTKEFPDMVARDLKHARDMSDEPFAQALRDRAWRPPPPSAQERAARRQAALERRHGPAPRPLPARKEDTR